MARRKNTDKPLPPITEETQVMTKEFLLWEMASRSTIDFEVVYVDVAGDLVAGLLLSQIVYWNLPDKSGNQTKLRIFKHDRYWLAKGREDWYDECRITAKQFDRAISILTRIGVIECRLMRFSGSPTKHIWLNTAVLHAKIKEALEPSHGHDFNQRSNSKSLISQIPNRSLVKFQTDEKVNFLTEIPAENLSKTPAKTSFPIDNPTSGRIINNPEAELQDFDRADSKKLDSHDERNFEPESKTNRLASLSKEEGGYSTTVRAAKKERVPRAAVAKKQPTPEETIAHDEDGWLVLPCKSKEFPRYKLPAAIALKRMHYKIAIEFLDRYFEFFEDEDGKWWVEDNFDGKTRSLASFEKAHPLKQVIELARSTKDSVKTTHQLDQNWFNEYLYKFYLDAIAFCDMWGSEAQSQSKSAPSFVLWDDLLGVNQGDGTNSHFPNVSHVAGEISGRSQTCLDVLTLCPQLGTIEG